MGTAKDRMDKIENALTPKQLVIAWIEEAHQSKSLREYAERTRQIETLLKRAEMWARERTRSEPADKVQKKIRDARRQTAFLYHLYLHVNEYFSSEWKPIGYFLLLLRERECASVQEGTGIRLYADRFDPRHDDLRSYSVEVFSLKAATEEIAKRYFDGHQVLLKYSAEQLDGLIQGIYSIRAMREIYYSAFKMSRSEGKKPYPRDCRLKFDLEALKRSIDPGKTVKELVDFAHLDTLCLMGDRQAGVNLVELLRRQLPDVNLDGEQNIG